MGMAMTEKQGGSDVRANTTQAKHLEGEEYQLQGHKWFCSAPMSDAFLTLAQTPKGLNEQAVNELRKSGFYKSLNKTTNSILKRLKK